MVVNVVTHNTRNDVGHTVLCFKMFGTDLRLCKKNISSTQGSEVIVVFVIKVCFGDVVFFAFPLGVKRFKITRKV